MLNRRSFLSLVSKTGLASATIPLWLNSTSTRALAQVATGYKAVVLVTLPGGNDGNNLIIPTSSADYSQYSSLRTTLAQPQSGLLPLSGSTNGKTYALHSSLANVANFYNQGTAAIVANVGPLKAPATKAQLLADSTLVPEALLSHPSQLAQWESASTLANPSTGWGGRMADQLASLSGTLPPLIDATHQSIFTIGQTVQGVAVQADGADLVSLPTGMDAAILAIARGDAKSTNQLIAQAANMRVLASQQQLVIKQAQAAGASLKTIFPSSSFGSVMQSIAQVLAGRSIIGANRQIFYASQGGYDTHENQWSLQAGMLADLDAGLGAFMAAVDELGLTGQVLVCTHSDFNRTLQANTTAGTDHAWGNHQIILGGGIKGGQIFGSMPEMDLGGSSDYGTQGIWIPTTSVTQMTASIGKWMGLNSTQLGTVFPDLANFSSTIAI